MLLTWVWLSKVDLVLHAYMNFVNLCQVLRQRYQLLLESRVKLLKRIESLNFDEVLKVVIDLAAQEVFYVGVYIFGNEELMNNRDWSLKVLPLLD